MLVRNEDVEIEQYNYLDRPGWVITIINDYKKEIYEAWLSYTKYGVMKFMRGMEHKDCSYFKFMEDVENDLPSAIRIYIERFF